MTTRRQLIQSIPALPLITTAGATALLVACGKKEEAVTSAPAPAPSPAPAPAVAAPAPAPAPAATTEATPATGTTAPTAGASTGPLLDEKDPQAVALGYVAVATKADKAKFPKYEAGQNCANCSLYLGAAAAQGACPLFPGKQVLATAWCSAWVKKAA